ncbi:MULTISPECIES: hypothetical protein [unclassified Lysinibacillus]|nr:hypothetical protein [Lysinibacillus sp. CD3-6]QPQ36704.1 hypothetical protein JNUCC52_07230 [Lysinibacillus sp. JNUCC-52]UED81562.1 hypothetical protein FH508_0006625 [Lysinibacillus sp. CD3-6]
MDIMIGIALILLVFFSSNIVEKRLKNIEKQNSRVIDILEEIKEELKHKK